MKKFFFFGILLCNLFLLRAFTAPVQFPADQSSGVIGTSPETPIDDPSDNVFHIQLDDPVTAGDRVWLVYELDGLGDHQSVSHSINDELAQGGYLVRLRQGFREQKEMVAPAWLRPGDNIIRFSLPEGAEHHYRVQNVRLEVEKGAASERELVINGSEEGSHFGDRAYIKGFIGGAAPEGAQVFVDGQQVRVHNGAFETVLRSPEVRGAWNIAVKAVFPDGEQLEKIVNLNWQVPLDYHFPAINALPATTVKFSAAEASRIELPGVRVQVPAAALGSPLFVSAQTLRDIDLPTLTPGMVNVSSQGHGFRFLPHTDKFDQDLQIEMAFDPERIPQGYTAKDIRTFYFDESTNHWVQLPYDSVDAETQTVFSRTDHFTDMINGIIKVPESPEGDAFNPTSLKDIKAADPSASINLMNPPGPNQMGNANLSYPLYLPPGRQGVMPQLAVGYNSGGGNGWMGLGWNLQMPAIMIDTRWGVPRYETQLETETYTLNGEQLTPLAHRDKFVARTADKQFYPRVEGSFSRIIRHGTSPRNYWWEVTDKSGLRYFYGGTPATGQDNNAVLKDNKGNVACWYLKEMRDLSDNFCRYTYVEVADVGTSGGSVTGRQKYIDEISYTGHGNTPGAFKVEFTRDRELGEPRRPDVQISGRNGLKEVTADLLREVKVSYNGDQVRRYAMNYTQGAFFKTLLQNIEEYSETDTLFTTHDFEYYDDVRNGNTYAPFNSQQNWNIGSDGIDADFITSISGFRDHVTALGGNESDSRTIGFGIAFGIFDGNLFSKSNTIGVNFHSTDAESDGLALMIDINGDALPDKVIIGPGGFSYRANLSGPDGSTSFGPRKPISGMNRFFEEESSTSSVGLELQLGGGGFSVFVGVNQSKTNSTTKVYFTDANGDQLVDIAVNGRVFFNRLDGNGNPQFAATSAGTPSPIFAGDPISGNISAVDSLEREEDIDNFPLHDAVRSWQAPYDGVINVVAPVRLIEDTSAARATAPADGVRMAIQLKGTELWTATVGPNDYSVKIPTGINGLSVSAGDRIYFRVQSVENGEYDQVEWDPVISYASPATTTQDANGREIYVYRASQDFLMSGTQVAGAPIDGMVRIEADLVKPVTSDSVTFLILEDSTNQIVWKRDYSWNTAVNFTLDTTLGVTKGMQFRFQVLAKTNVDWSAVRFDPHFYYTASNDPNVPSVVTAQGGNLIEYFPVSYFSVYAEPTTATQTWRAPADGTLEVVPLLNFAGTPTGEVTFSIKQQHRLLIRKDVKIVNGQIASDSLLSIPVLDGEEYYIELHTQSPVLDTTYLGSKIDLKFIIQTNLSLAGFGSNVVWDAPIDGTIFLSPSFTIPGAATGGIVRSSTVAGNTISDTILVILSNVPDDTLAVSIDSLQQLVFSYQQGFGISQGQINNLGSDLLFIHRDTIGAAFHPIVGDPYFGPFYRQWGIFGYNGNRSRATQPINESELKLDSALYHSLNISLTDSTASGLLNQYQSQGGFEMSTMPFIPYYPNGEFDRWMGFDDLTYITANSMSSSRMGLDDLTQSSPLPDSSIVIGSGLGAGAYAIRKVSKTRTSSFSAGAGVFGVSGSYGESDTDTRIVSDFQDMNGDRYPDILTSSVVQYTNPYGGLSSKTLSHGHGDNHRSQGESKGVTLGGSYSRPMPTVGATNIDGSMKTHAGSSESGTAALNIGGNYGETEDEADYTYADLNGDGLPDRIRQQGNQLFVRLNLGYQFAPSERWDAGRISEGESQAFGASAGLGLNYDAMSLGVGVGLSRSENEGQRSLQDINGDGLADYVVKNGSGVFVNFNVGNGFGPTIQWAGANDISQAQSISESINATFTFGIPIIPFAPVFKLVFNPSFSASNGVSRTHQMISDVNGDGYPDYLTSSKDDNLQVKMSTIGRTNMLKMVERPMGSNFKVDYEREGNTYAMPNSIWTLQQVEVYDGFDGDGADTMRTEFAYADGYYDRHEREFYGFETVEVKSLDTENNDALYTRMEMTFENGNYYEKGLVLEEVMEDGQGNKYSEKRNQYQPQDALTGNPVLQGALQSTTLSLFPALTQTEQLFYEGQPNPGESTRMSYAYDRFGNMVEFTDFGDTGPADDLSAEVSYHNYQSTYLVGVPSAIRVFSGNTTFREREADLDSVSGNITQIRQYLQNGDAAVHDMDYDVYGNLSRITRPENQQGQRFALDYQYDPDVFTYVTQVDNSYGYTSTSTYDVMYGQVLERTDLNGNQILTELDDVGRVSKVTGPFEIGSGNFTLRFEYHPDGVTPWALTEHYDPAHPNNTIRTATFMDGLGRAIQVKKDISLFQGDGLPDVEQMQVSGRVIFDAFGRTIHSYYPTTEGLGTIGLFNPTFDTQNPTSTDYDVLNRAVRVTLPDGAQTVSTYGFGSDRNNQTQFSTLVTDANGVQVEQFKDVRDRLTAVKNITSFGDVWTSFTYNAINEKTSSSDDLGYITEFEYDWFGRTVARSHPDQGLTTFEYDLASNMVQLQTANLATTGDVIRYVYDFERLKKVSYPINKDNDVEYFYGPAGAPFNRTGRVMVQQDATGAQEFFYGPLGEVVKNIRTVVVPLHDEKTFVTEWTYDTWNRITEMVYPDGEILTYTYNLGGKLATMAGEKAGNTYNYVDQLGYDKFEQRVFLAYGNGTKTNYAYEADRRRLQNLVATTASGRKMMDNVYSYDLTQNILNITNNAPIPASNLMGGPSSNDFEYDDLYRLTSAEGSHSNSNHEHRYSLEMSYNSVGSILTKDRDHDRRNTGTTNWVDQNRTSHNLAYTYDPNSQPHTPKVIDDRTFSYDPNGNQTGWEHNVNGTRREIVWDEENRMRLLYDNGVTNIYAYDASNTRVLKGQGRGQLVSQNGGSKSNSVGIGNFTMYVNPYTVVRSGGYTKHFYIESQRIVSKLGDTPNLGVDTIRAGQDSVDYALLFAITTNAISNSFNNMGGGNVTVTPGNGNGNAYGQGNGNGGVGQGNGNGNGQNNSGGNGNGNGGNGNGNGSGGNGSGGGTSNPGEQFQYFYHPNHLGSSAYITDALGEAYQHLEYFPFGETFVEEHSNTWRTPYLFNGKELDEETALYYYGARYYDPMTSVWLSVDPLADKYAGWSPYNYTLDNPVVYGDPDGREPKNGKISGEIYYGKSENGTFVGKFDGEISLQNGIKAGGIISGIEASNEDFISLDVDGGGLSFDFYRGIKTGKFIENEVGGQLNIGSVSKESQKDIRFSITAGTRAGFGLINEDIDGDGTHELGLSVNVPVKSAGKGVVRFLKWVSGKDLKTLSNLTNNIPDIGLRVSVEDPIGQGIDLYRSVEETIQNVVD